MIVTVKGSVFNDLPPHSVIMNAVNARGWISGGFSRQIQQRWPKCFEDYHEFCGWFKNGHEKEIMGHLHHWQVSTKLIIVNCITIQTYGKDRQVTDYEAWERCAKVLEAQTRNQNLKTGVNWTLHAPEKIGVLNGEEDATEIRRIFNEVFGQSSVDLVLHSLA